MAEVCHDGGGVFPSSVPPRLGRVPVAAGWGDDFGVEKSGDAGRMGDHVWSALGAS